MSKWIKITPDDMQKIESILEHTGGNATAVAGWLKVSLPTVKNYISGKSSRFRSKTKKALDECYITCFGNEPQVAAAVEIISLKPVFKAAEKLAAVLKGTEFEQDAETLLRELALNIVRRLP